MKRTYGWRPDLPDKRDRPFSSRHVDLATLPEAVDLRGMCSPVEDQGSLGSCTANALVGLLEFLENKEVLSTCPPDLSRLFLYYNERRIEKTIDYDSGATIRDGIKALAKYGVCLEADWPYIVDAFNYEPRPECYAAALDHRISLYQRLNSLSDMLSCLADGFPFAFGFTVYSAMESDEVAKTGMLDLPRGDEMMIGGHAVLCVGYDRSTERFLIRNSWGASWADGGYFRMPFTYLTDRNLSDDFWSVRR